MTDTALAIIEEKNVSQYFVNNGLDPVLERIREEVSGIVPDISTEKGRKEIASLAYKVAKSKTTLDDMGKKLVSGIKEQAKAIDAERRRAWDALEAIQKEVRAPLTEWENAEKARVAGFEAAIAAIPEHPEYGQNECVAEISERLTYLENLPARDWQEFSARAAMTLSKEIDRTRSILDTAQKREAEAADLARLRQEEADRKRREHEARLQAEAAEKARVEAEARAKAAAEAEAARVRAEQAKTDEERRRMERDKEEAEARARKAEADRKAAEEKAAADAIAAQEQAQRDAELAARREREKIEAERAAEAAALSAREADKAHRGRINSEVLNAIHKAGLAAGEIFEPTAKAITVAIAKGEIPHVKINY